MKNISECAGKNVKKESFAVTCVCVGKVVFSSPLPCALSGEVMKQNAICMVHKTILSAQDRLERLDSKEGSFCSRHSMHGCPCY